MDQKFKIIFSYILDLRAAWACEPHPHPHTGNPRPSEHNRIKTHALLRPFTGLRMSLWSLCHLLFTVKPGSLRLSHTLINGNRHREVKLLVQGHHSYNCIARGRGNRTPHTQLSLASRFFLANSLFFFFPFLRFFPHLDPCLSLWSCLTSPTPPAFATFAPGLLGA